MDPAKSKDVADLRAVETVRATRIRALSPSERVERLHHLCAQLSAFSTRGADGRS